MINLNPMDFSNDSLLSELQGNILKGHGRHHTTHIFVHFNSRREKKASEWLSSFADNHVTCCKKQLKDRELFNRNNIDGGLFASVFFTSKGYEYFKPTERVLLTDPAFLAGMKSRINVNNDPNTAKWEKGFREDSHIMILLADSSPNRMGTFAKDLLEELGTFSHICSVEYGNAIFNANGDGLEHFGYVDGVSQPFFLKDEVDSYMAFHAITAQNKIKFDPTADTDLVLVKDPYSTKPDAFGSYFVFRKLEQHVQQFKKTEKGLGLGERGGASIVGRFEDGSPVRLSDEDGMIGSGNFNNFNYDNDPSGGRCPHFAHIRKVNPRRDVTAGNDHKSHIMARRGIPYGQRSVSAEVDPTFDQMPTGDVGLLFMSYQKSIVNQFEFIQQNWANNKDFEASTTGIDAIIGQSNDLDARKYDFPKPYNTTPDGTNIKDFKQFVDMKGGEYFFAPSMSFLKNI